MEKKMCNVHDYSLGTLICYRDNPKLEYFENYILATLPDGSQMQLCFTKDAPVKCAKRDYLEPVENSEERLETVYDTEKVFDRATYENSKKYQDKVKRWLNYFTNNDFRIDVLEQENLEDVNKLYKEWYELKELDEPMIRRYQNCIDAAFNDDIKDTIAIGMFNSENKLVGFRTFYIREDGWAFDLSNTVTRTDYKYLSEVFQVNTLKWLKDNLNVKFYNLGLSDGSLRLHKTLLPNFDIAYYVVR